MKPIYIFCHHPAEGPGLLADFLDSKGMLYRLIRVDDGEALPENLDDTSGLVFMGGPMSVNDNLPWTNAELTLFRRAAVISMPVLGHCRGAQLMSKALPRHIANPIKEIVQTPVTHTFTESGKEYREFFPE